jgi:serine/threonine-protein kinase
VALKCLRPTLERDRRHVATLEAEALVLGRLSHPNVVELVDAGRADGTPFLATTRVDGADFRELQRRSHEDGRPVPLGIALTIVGAVCRGLHHAHGHGRAGVVHRDVKAANVLVSVDGRVELADFGAALGLEEAAQAAIEFTGTLAYAAPEQVRGRPLGPWTDVFGAGCVLYQALTGTPPFVRGSRRTTVDAIVLGDYVPASVRRPAIDTRIDAIVARSLARDPAARFSTAAKMADALEAANTRGEGAVGPELGRWVRAVLDREPPWSGRFPTESARVAPTAPARPATTTTLPWARRVRALDGPPVPGRR